MCCNLKPLTHQTNIKELVATKVNWYFASCCLCLHQKAWKPTEKSTVQNVQCKTWLTADQWPCQGLTCLPYPEVYSYVTTETQDSRLRRNTLYYIAVKTWNLIWDTQSTHEHSKRWTMMKHDTQREPVQQVHTVHIHSHHHIYRIHLRGACRRYIT